MKRKHEKNKKYVYISLAIIVLLGFFFLFKSSEDNYILLDVTEIGSDASWFEYEYEGDLIRYFVVRDRNGDIKTAFDACDVCYNSKKGYTQDGDYMVCNNCGQRFLISELGRSNTGGCNPGYLDNFVENDFVHISKSDLERGKRYFGN